MLRIPLAVHAWLPHHVLRPLQQTVEIEPRPSNETPGRVRQQLVGPILLRHRFHLDRLDDVAIQRSVEVETRDHPRAAVGDLRRMRRRQQHSRLPGSARLSHFSGHRHNGRHGVEIEARPIQPCRVQMDLRWDIDAAADMGDWDSDCHHHGRYIQGCRLRHVRCTHVHVLNHDGHFRDLAQNICMGQGTVLWRSYAKSATAGATHKLDQAIHAGFGD
mmetsp:Transcript_5331/g.15657  ORF Transcript_5331/g.15657 Transcript_5331/m.15657 type:complete len:217 (-) Transcript_5331:631-1281(-)